MSWTAIKQAPPGEHLTKAAEALNGRALSAALYHFDAAEQEGADPDACASGRWQAHMLCGSFSAAWRESDAIRARGAADPNRFWNGEALEGKRVMVRCLHGLGDAVHMLAYLPLLRSQCAEVTVEVPPRMVPLARYFDGVQQVMTWGADAPKTPPAWDVQVEVMELPYLFRTAASQLPVAERYLCVPDGTAAEPLLKPHPGGSARVGLVWSASEWDSTRKLPVDCLQRVASCTGVEFWNLQGGDEHGRRKQQAAQMGLRDAAEFGEGLVALAASIARLDLVITVDTLAAHLAGALGTPAWVLLQQRADWRWMHGASDSPWYPTLRLFRQSVQDDWHSLTDEIRKALAIWKETRHV